MTVLFVVVYLDRVRPIGHMDMMSDIAYPLPATVIAELLGVPTADLPRFKRSMTLPSRLEHQSLSGWPLPIVMRNSFLILSVLISLVHPISIWHLGMEFTYVSGLL